MDSIPNQKLAMRSEAKYLGVTIRSDLFWSRYADNVTKRETLRLVSSRETLGLHHKLQMRLPTRHEFRLANSI